MLRITSQHNSMTVLQAVLNDIYKFKEFEKNAYFLIVNRTKISLQIIQLQ